MVSSSIRKTCNLATIIDRIGERFGGSAQYAKKTWSCAIPNSRAGEITITAVKIADHLARGIDILPVPKSIGRQGSKDGSARSTLL
jgi:hypothetical protein